MNNLVKKSINLPTNIEDLRKFVLIGRDKLVSVRAYIRAIDKLGLAKEVREQKRDEANMLAGALLDAEARMGHLLNDQTERGGSMDGRRGSKKSLPEGITHKQSSAFQTLAANEDIIEQVKADAEAEDDLPTRMEVLRRVKEKNNEIHKKEKAEKYKKLKNTELPPKKYGIIYADPPWEYYAIQQLDGKITSAATDHYPTMSIDQLCALNIKELADENCTLFIWTTSPLLEFCFPVINAWGFSYRASFVWDKVKHNVGHYNSVRHEFLLIAVKGKGTPDNMKSFDSVQSIEKTKKHSEKPFEFRNIIDTLYPKREKIELFARIKSDGWDVWGNESI